MFGIYRFVLALNVMLFHILALPTIGPLAVYSFFILSGFLMTTIMHKSYGYSKKGMKNYCINRFLRLYPTYWFLVSIIILIILLVGAEFAATSHSKMQIPQNFGEWLANWAMIFPYFNPIEYSPRIAPPTWALTIELFFYVLIGLGISKNKTISLAWFTCSLLYIVVSNIYTGSFGTGYGNILSASLPFSIGAVIYYYQKELSLLLKKAAILPFLVSLVFVINVIAVPAAESFLSPFYDTHGWKLNLLVTWANIPLSALMTVLLFEVKSNNILVLKLDTRVGDYSYPLYIFHTAAACLASWIYLKLGFESKSEYIVGVFLLALVITICVAELSEILINKKINKLRFHFKRVNNS
jgi:peptidoglycan/LPS O-acetylase OafA/YrhL